MLSIEILRKRLHHCVGSLYDPEVLQRGRQLSHQIDQLVIAYMKRCACPVAKAKGDS